MLFRDKRILNAEQHEETHVSESWYNKLISKADVMKLWLRD